MRRLGWSLYRNTLRCIATGEQKGKARLYCNTTQPSPRHGSEARRLGAQVLGGADAGHWGVGRWERGTARVRTGGTGRAGHDAATRPVGRPQRSLCALAGPNWGTVHLTQF